MGRIAEPTTTTEKEDEYTMDAEEIFSSLNDAINKSEGRIRADLKILDERYEDRHGHAVKRLDRIEKSINNLSKETTKRYDDLSRETTKRYDELSGIIREESKIIRNESKSERTESVLNRRWTVTTVIAAIAAIGAVAAAIIGILSSGG